MCVVAWGARARRKEAGETEAESGDGLPGGLGSPVGRGCVGFWMPRPQHFHCEDDAGFVKFTPGSHPIP